LFGDFGFFFFLDPPVRRELSQKRKQKTKVGEKKQRDKKTLAISQVADHLSRHLSNLSSRLSDFVLPSAFQLSFAFSDLDLEPYRDEGRM